MSESLGVWVCWGGVWQHYIDECPKTRRSPEANIIPAALRYGGNVPLRWIDQNRSPETAGCYLLGGRGRPQFLGLVMGRSQTARRTEVYGVVYGVGCSAFRAERPRLLSSPIPAKGFSSS